MNPIDSSQSNSPLSKNVSAPGDRSASASWSEPPGGILVWIIVVLEVMTFGMGLVAFLVQGREHAEMFRHGRAMLSQSIGMANTLILLTGGLFMANAVSKLRQGRVDAAKRWLIAAIGSGLLFLVLKSIEYADKLHHGFDLHADTFFMFYWLLTGFHFVHVLVAVVILLFMWRGIQKGRYTSTRHEDVESSAVFWHMCDLIWLLLYPVIYLLH